MSKETIPCPVCDQPLSFRLVNGRKSGKSFIQLLCTQDGRHFRGFIGDKTYINGILHHLEENQNQVKEDIQ